jgi:hypothetical protein
MNSLSALNRADYSIEEMCDMSETSRVWMGASDADSFDWAR